MSLLLGKTHWNVYRKRNVSLIRFCTVLGKCVHVYTYADICMFVLYIIIQMQRGRKKIISNSWWIWAKHIWKYDVGSGICFCGSMLKRRQRLFWAIHAPVHRVPSCFLSSCCDVLLLKDSLFFHLSLHISQRWHISPEIFICLLLSDELIVLEGLSGEPGRVGGQLWLTVGSGTLVAQVLGSTHWGELCWRPPFDTKTWPHLSCVFIWLLYSALQIPPSGNSLRSEWM